jgi:hypothetical protein
VGRVGPTDLDRVDAIEISRARQSVARVGSRVA